MTSPCPACDTQITGKGGFYRCGPCLSLWELAWEEEELRPMFEIAASPEVKLMDIKQRRFDIVGQVELGWIRIWEVEELEPNQEAVDERWNG